MGAAGGDVVLVLCGLGELLVCFDPAGSVLLPNCRELLVFLIFLSSFLFLLLNQDISIQ